VISFHPPIAAVLLFSPHSMHSSLGYIVPGGKCGDTIPCESLIAPIMASEIEMPRLRVTYHGSLITSTGTPHNTTLTSTGIGHTVARFFEQGGAVVDRIININYRGPLGPKMNIEAFFGQGHARERVLNELYDVNSGGVSSNNYEALLRDCHDLLKYAGTGCVFVSLRYTPLSLYDMT